MKTNLPAVPTDFIERTPVVRTDGMDIFKLGDVLAKSGYFQDTRDAAQAIVKILAGQELGIPVVAAMTGIYLVKGRVTLSANLMASLVKRNGYNYRVIDLSDERCRLEFFQRGESIGVSEFTTSDAKKAGLGGDNWVRYPRNMLFARAMSNGVRWYCPDVTNGPVYTPDELGDPAAIAPTVETRHGRVNAVTGEVIEPAKAALPPGPPLGATPTPEPTPEPAPDASSEINKRTQALYGLRGYLVDADEMHARIDWGTLSPETPLGKLYATSEQADCLLQEVPLDTMSTDDLKACGRELRGLVNLAKAEIAEEIAKAEAAKVEAPGPFDDE